MEIKKAPPAAARGAFFANGEKCEFKGRRKPPLKLSALVYNFEDIKKEYRLINKYGEHRFGDRR